ncbi:CAP domain-containing protein [Choanephora cucurbitarum]|nr:CAP domain-containing protein [Choanephora cucurbitarum]
MLFNKVLAALILSQAVLAAPKPLSESESLTVTTTTSVAATGTPTATSRYQGWRYKGSYGKKNEYTHSDEDENESGSTGEGDSDSTGDDDDNTSDVTTTAKPTTTAKATSTSKATATGKATPTSSAGSDDVQSEALAIHNKYRKAHHVPDVTWSTKLADHAQTVTDSCVWGHSVLKGAGQNIAYGYKSMEAVIDAWYNEGKNYNYGTNSYSSSTGHFTQVVWKSTTEIGCAATYCSNLRGTYYVCDYSPPGNYAGKYADNVVAP